MIYGNVMLYTTPEGTKRVDEMTREELLGVIDHLASEINMLRTWSKAKDEVRRLHKLAFGH